MYSPVIREDLIPRIYQAAKGECIPMTTWVNRAVERALSSGTQTETNEQNRKEQDSNE